MSFILGSILLLKHCSIHYCAPLFQIIFPINFLLLRVPLCSLLKVIEYSTCLPRVVIFMLFIFLFVLKMKMQ